MENFFFVFLIGVIEICIILFVWNFNFLLIMLFVWIFGFFVLSKIVICLLVFFDVLWIFIICVLCFLKFL